MEDCKEKIVTVDLPAISTVFNATISDMKDLGLDKVIALPKYDGKKTSLYRHRNSTFGVDKTVFGDVKNVEIPAKFENFMLADYCEGNTRIIVFCSYEARKKMEVLKDFFGDGTFKSCPRLFHQIFTIHADLGSNHESTALTPLVYALMTNRTKKSYEILFSLIKSQIPNWNLISFTCDFEEATISAIMKVFPDVHLQGCYYHFNKAVWKKGRELDLTKSKILRRQVALSAVLPLLPENRIIEGWFYVANQSPDDSQSTKFRNYMISQWLRPHLIKIWCSYGKRHRTNNFAEGWHCKLNNAVGRKNPTILKLLTILHQDANLYTVKSTQSPKRRTQNSIQTDEFIKECQTKLVSAEITVGHFLEILR